MMWTYYYGWSWIGMVLMMVLFWGGLAALVVFALRSLSQPRDSALETVRRRFAAGEISQEEFEQAKHSLGA